MTGEFMNHPLPVKLTFCRMVQDMQTDQSAEQFLVLYLCRCHFKAVLSMAETTYAFLRIPTNATTHSNGSRPGIPIDRDQCGAGADSAVG